MRMPAICKSASVPLLLWLAFFSIDAQAEINNSGVLDNVLARYAAAASAWSHFWRRSSTNERPQSARTFSGVGATSRFSAASYSRSAVS